MPSPHLTPSPAPAGCGCFQLRHGWEAPSGQPSPQEPPSPLHPAQCPRGGVPQERVSFAAHTIGNDKGGYVASSATLEVAPGSQQAGHRS